MATTAFDPRIIDNWGYLSFKAGLDGVTNPRWIQQNWLPEDEQRRLTAYKVLSAYTTNNARAVLSDVMEDKRIEQREYGDPALIVSRIVSGILGDAVTVVLPELQAALADPPSLSDRPVDPGEDADEIETMLYDASLEVWTAEKTEAIETWKRNRAELTRLRASADWLDWWMDVEQVVAKITEGEAQYAVPLGDSLYGLAYSTDKARPVLTLYPPDAYMPELDDSSNFPEKVHLVWQEVPEDDAPPETTRIRRITYELVTEEQLPNLDGWSSALPYADEPPMKQCVITDVTFNLADFPERRWKDGGTGHVLNWANSQGVVNLNENDEELDLYPLGIDFIPLIHVPNTPSTVEHYGTSSLSRVARLLDDIVATDTDIQRASALAGSPVLGLRGANVNPNEPLDIFPGKIVALGQDGDMKHIDMSPSVDVLDRTKDSLLERLAVNVQIPETMWGRVDTTAQFPSGVAMRLSFQSFISLIDTLRLARAPKFSMMLKMVQRLHIANGSGTDEDDSSDVSGSDQVVRAELMFGEFIPADVAETVTLVSTLLGSNGISRNTASTMLQEVGLPIEDVKDEVAAVNREDTAGAKDAADATGSEQVAADLFGVEIEEPVTPPDVSVTPLVTLPTL